MERGITQIQVRGKRTNVPSLFIEGRNVVVTGGLLKTAQIQSENYVEYLPMDDPDGFVAQLKESQLPADIFSFAQSIHQLTPKFPQYHMEWDNFAAICLSSYEDWWKGLSQDSRRNVRTAEKRGVNVRIASFDDDLIRGIKAIYDEVPVRQGFRNRHYQQDFETIRQKNSTFLGHDDFLCAYLGEDLIGFIQIIYTDRTARIMQVLSKTAHLDKRPTSVLMAKAVEIACQKKLTHLTYCKYTYGKKGHDHLTEFKRRMGFQKLCYPRYYVPLTWRGAMAVNLRLHHGLKDLLPARCLIFLLNARGKYYEMKIGRHEALRQVSSPKVKALMVDER